MSNPRKTENGQNTTLGSRFRSKTQITLFIIDCAILLILIFNLFGLVNFWPHPIPQPVIVSTRVVTYELQWQNQPGQPFTCGVCSPPQYLWLNIDLTLTSNFIENSKLAMYAQGTMSKALANSSLAYIAVTYDGAVAYTPNQIAYSGEYGINLNVVPNGTFAMDYALGPTVSILGEPVNITWRFAGGPHYPTLDIHYWTGEDITHQFTNAPLMIQSSPTQPPSQPTSDTPDEKGANWVIGSSIIAVVEVMYLRFPRKTETSPEKKD